MAAQLLFSPTSCGAASFIAANRAGIIGGKVCPNLVDLGAKLIVTGDLKGDLLAVNPKGNVPTLVLPDKTMLNEGAAILQWIADQNEASGLAPAWGTTARYLLQSKLNWIASEFHASISALYLTLSLPAEAIDAGVAKVKSKLRYLSDVELAGGRPFLVGDGFTVADAYCYIVLSWLALLDLDLSLEDYPVLKRYFDSIAALDFVKDSHAKMAAIAAAVASDAGGVVGAK